MSRIGNAQIQIPDKVELKVQGNLVHVKGPLGELTSPLPEGINLEQKEGGMAEITRKDDSRQLKSMHGTSRSLLANSIKGVHEGWKRRLELVGVGYRAQVKGNELILSLGYSHDVHYTIPAMVQATVKDQTKIELESIDKQKLGQVAAEIRNFRSPEPYKGKGVKYENERIRRKAGKTGKK